MEYAPPYEPGAPVESTHTEEVEVTLSRRGLAC